MSKVFSDTHIAQIGSFVACKIQTHQQVIIHWCDCDDRRNHTPKVYNNQQISIVHLQTFIHTQILFNQPISPELLLIRLLLVRPVPKSKLLEIVVVEIVVAELLQAGRQGSICRRGWGGPSSPGKTVTPPGERLKKMQEGSLFDPRS